MTVPILGPQPGPVSCCDSCQIIARSLTLIADAIGYPKTAREDLNTEAVNQ